MTAAATTGGEGTRTVTARRRRRRRRLRARALALAIALAAALGAAEAAVRATDVDWRYIEKITFYQSVDLANHEAVADPNIRFRLKPGSAGDYGRYRVTINSLGFRGPERPAAKPAGARRILVVGGSNPYGANLNDNETWPAQLERRLRASPGGGCWEVWNLGVSAQGGRQHAALAAEAIGRIRPDVTIVALSNAGIMPFLIHAPIRPYFERDPLLWRNMVVGAAFPVPPLAPVGVKTWLTRHLRIYRLAMLAWIDRTLSEPGGCGGGQYEGQNVDAIRKLLADFCGDTRFAFFLCPHSFCQEADGDHKRRYTKGMHAPVLSLEADDKPPEYRAIHPPAYVMDWYAENIADWLVDEGLVTPCEKP